MLIQASPFEYALQLINILLDRPDLVTIFSLALSDADSEHTTDDEHQAHHDENDDRHGQQQRRVLYAIMSTRCTGYPVWV